MVYQGDDSRLQNVTRIVPNKPGVYLVILLVLSLIVYLREFDFNLEVKHLSNIISTSGWKVSQLTHSQIPQENATESPAVDVKMFVEPVHKKFINISKAETQPKIILLWNNYFDIDHYGFNETLLWELNCPYKNCLVTENRTHYPMSEVDAVMWHVRGDDKRIPKIRKTWKTKLVFFALESPYHIGVNLVPIRNKFHLTFTYKTDSDIASPYGLIGRRRKFLAINKDYHANKSLMAAWFVSNCASPSNRERLLTTLLRNMSVDVYGNCGALKCPKMTEDGCYKMVARNYFFYLSFENSICEDYLTEKIFNVLKYDIIPVVFGMGPSYRKHLPPRSYIDVFDFHSVEEVWEHLVYLTQNATAYNEYFRWKETMTVIDGRDLRTLTFCDLCKQLHSSRNSTSKSSIKNIAQWFSERSNCIKGTDQTLSYFIRGGRLEEPYNQILYKEKRQISSFKEYSESIYLKYNEIA